MMIGKGMPIAQSKTPRIASLHDFGDSRGESTIQRATNSDAMKTAPLGKCSKTRFEAGAACPNEKAEVPGNLGFISMCETPRSVGVAGDAEAEIEDPAGGVCLEPGG